MKSLTIRAVLTCSLSVLPLLTNAENMHPTQEIQEARSLVKAFSSDLKSALTNAMKTDGPINALKVCHLQAGPIAEKHAALSGWKIARTAEKVRN